MSQIGGIELIIISNRKIERSVLFTLIPGIVGVISIGTYNLFECNSSLRKDIIQMKKNKY